MEIKQTHNDPNRFLWYLVYIAITVVSGLPLFGLRLSDFGINYLLLLFIHEFSAFLFFGHTFFSNIWAMQIRFNQDKEVGIWARGFLRKLALSITMTTSIIIPITGLMLMESWGGLINAPWAWNAYLAFWAMAAISITPDIIRYGRNRNSADPKHGMVSGAIRGNIGTVLTIYIICCMVIKISWIKPFPNLFIG
ncbi:hypothetical protein OAP06_04075 [Gammaproteobacteria bacterium]|jgi:hypothetical protein|nr:hypothetical protein [Gammaproteobacteria bacterium]